MSNLIQQVYASDGTTHATQSVNSIELTNISSLADVFALAINIILGIGVALTVIYLILGGIQYMTSKGDQKAAQEARTSLTNAIVGFIVVIGAFTIRTILANIIGASEDITIDPIDNLDF